MRPIPTCGTSSGITEAQYQALAGPGGGAPPVDPLFPGTQAEWNTLWKQGPQRMRAALRRPYDTPSGDIEKDCVLRDFDGPGTLLVCEGDIDLDRVVVLQPHERAAARRRRSERAAQRAEARNMSATDSQRWTQALSARGNERSTGARVTQVVTPDNSRPPADPSPGARSSPGQPPPRRRRPARTPELEQAIVNGAAMDHSQRQISRETGAPRVTVQRILATMQPQVNDLRTLKRDEMLTAWQSVYFDTYQEFFDKAQAGTLTPTGRKDLAITLGISSEKSLLLSGHPTVLVGGIHELRISLPEIAQRLAEVSRAIGRSAALAQ